MEKPIFYWYSRSSFPFLFLFVSIKKSAFHTTVFGILLSVSILAVNQKYDTYFSNVFFLHIHCAYSNLEHLGSQLYLYLQYNLGLILIFLLSFSLQPDTCPKKGAL